MKTSLSRRHFLTTASSWLTASAFAAPSESDFQTVSIIHTTDLHGNILPTANYSGNSDLGGFARCATRIRQWQRANPASITVDIGDLIQGTPESHLDQGTTMVRLLEKLKYDAWALGNHDFDWGPEALSDLIEIAKPAVLCANLREFHKQVLSWKMMQKHGFKIALIGLITPGLRSWLPPELLGPVQHIKIAEALEKAIMEARSAGANATVVLGHLGHRKADDFANPLRQILNNKAAPDVFLAGHTHKNISKKSFGETLYSQAGYHGIHLGKVDLTFDRHSRKLIHKNSITETMDSKIALDPIILNITEPILAKSAPQQATVLTTLPSPISGGGRNSPLANFLCKSFYSNLSAQSHPVDAVFHGTFGNPEIPSGVVTVATTWKLLPYENTLVTAKIPVRELLKIIAEDLKTQSDRTLYPFSIVFDKKTPSAILSGNKILPNDQEIVLAVNSYDSQSAGRTLPHLKKIFYHPGSKRSYINLSTREALINTFMTT